MQTRTDDEVVAEEGEAEKGLVIERRFTTAGADPFDAFDWIEMSVEIRNPDGSLADEIHGVQLPSGFAGVPGKVCAQKYLRKAGVPAALRKVAEDGVPGWLQRSEPDHERPSLQRTGLSVRRMVGNCSAALQAPGPTGVGLTATLPVKPMLVPSTMRWLT